MFFVKSCPWSVLPRLHTRAWELSRMDASQHSVYIVPGWLSPAGHIAPPHERCSSLKIGASNGVVFGLSLPL